MLLAQSLTREASSKSSSSFDGLYHVGWVKQAHGIRGELFLFLKANRADWLKDFKQVQLAPPPQSTFKASAKPVQNSVNSHPVSFAVKSAKVHKQGLIVSIDGITDRNQAESLKGYEVWISRQYLMTENAEEPFLLELLDFQVFDPAGKLLGKVVAFGSNGAQDLLVIENSSGRFDVPYVDAFVISLTFESKSMVLDLPEGLVNL